jgi:hypothetical protein
MRHVGLLKQRDKPPPFSYLLSDQEASSTINTVFGNVPLGSCLAYQMQNFGRPNTVFIINAIRTCGLANRQGPCTLFPDIPLGDSTTITLFDVNCLKNFNGIDYTSAGDYFIKTVSIDLKQAQALEKTTVLQGESSEWLEQHNVRVTASNLGIFTSGNKSLLL